MQALEKAAAAKGAGSFILHAQTQAVPFYENKDTASHPAKNFQMRASPSGNDKGIQTIKSKALLLI